MIFRFAVLDLVEKCGCISEAVSYRQLYFHSGNFHRSFFDSFQSSDFVIFDALEIFAGKNIRNRSESRFHYTAGSTEDDACAGRRTERILKLTVAVIEYIYFCSVFTGR